MREKNQKVLYRPEDDVRFQRPYIDREEPRERMLPDGSSIAYHYVHGGFEGTGLKFVFCLPEAARYRGHFIQYLSPFPGPDEENASLVHEGEDDKIAFCLLHGFYFVESNMASESAFGMKSDPSLTYQASAAAGAYSRRFAMDYYGCGRPYGYVYGGSGGGYKTIACIENTTVWDGACPYVIGSPVSLPNTIVMHVQGERLLRRAFRSIVDAVDCGGTGDPYERLTAIEKEALLELTAMGIPMKAWAQESRGHYDDGALPVLLPGIRAMDPDYFHDFWNQPGYEGHDDVLGAKRDRMYFECRVVRVFLPEDEAAQAHPELGQNGVDTAWKKMLTDGGSCRIETDCLPEGDDLYLQGTDICFVSGEAEGKRLRLGDIRGNILFVGECYGMEKPDAVLSRVRPGDRIRLDNSDYLAAQYYYRHQVPQDRDFHAWDQFRNEDGTAKLPQRGQEMGYGFSGTGTVQDGCVQGKVIITQALADESTCPWCADWYYQKVCRASGEDMIRLYYMDNVMHSDAAQQSTFMTNYQGQLKQSLLDLAAWVEEGKEPLPSTAYAFRNGQIEAERDSAKKNGMQPDVDMTVNGGHVVHAEPGQELMFRVEMRVPRGAGTITSVRYDFSEEDRPCDFTANCFTRRGTYEKTAKNGVFGAISRAVHAYARPGVYYASVLVSANRNGDAEDFFTQVKNIARVKVIVEG